MAEFVAISKERHADRTWRRPADFSFARGDAVSIILSMEIPRAMMSMALGFIEQADALVPVSVQGLKAGHNRLVSETGRWLADYVPAVYRAYPFRLARNQEGAEVLCIDETAAAVSEGPGQPFFMPDGSAAPEIVSAAKLLKQIENDRLNTQKACEALVRHKLTEPWPLRVQDGSDTHEIGGLFRIAEARLNELSPDALADVRNNGGLMVAYGQLFSMQHVQKLVRPRVQNASSPESPAPKLREENGIISFANL